MLPTNKGFTLLKELKGELIKEIRTLQREKNKLE
jgi:hypothetical protein